MNKFDRVYLNLIKEDSSDTVGPVGNLTLNKETNRWDCNGSLIIKPDMIIDGMINMPLGVINGNLDCMGLDQLKSCHNFPTKVTGNVDLANCTELQNLDGLKECQIDGQLEIGHNGDMTSDDFVEAMKPNTKIWDYVNMDADMYDEQLDMYYDQNHDAYWNWKQNRWDRDPQ